MGAPAPMPLIALLMGLGHFAGCAGEGADAPPRPAAFACTRNYQCPGSACDDDGTCHDPTRVLLVEDDPATCRAAGDPAADRPYCHVRDALLDPGIGVTSGPGRRDVILIRPSHRGGYFRDGDYTFVSETVRLVGVRTARTDPQVLLREPIYVKPNKAHDISVGIDDLRVSAQMSGGVSGILCLRDGEQGEPKVAFSVRWSQVDHMPITGVATEWCGPMRFISNVVIDNAAEGGGGVSIADSGLLTMVNNIVARNGNKDSLKGGVALSHQFAGSLVAFNTMVDNHCSGLDEYHGCNIHCHHHDNNDLQPMFFNIAVGTDPGRESVTGGCEMMNSVLPSDYRGFGRDHMLGLQPRFVDPAHGDYHLVPGDPANRALRVPTAQTPSPFDIDGDPRPAGGGVDVGADQSLSDAPVRG